ncbi:MAG: hypothetical protein BWY76_00690 [bacterium ADurb.Bin429]|nr:MAG: hypothetical protein BWY76_00690 [bacterium ADurb.Bin429]
MAGMTPWVRQYTLRDLLDDSFDLFRERAATLVLAGMVPALLVVVYAAGVRYFLLPGNLLREFSLEALGEMLQNFEFLFYLLGYSLVSWLALSYTYIAQLRIATAEAQGKTLTLNDAYTRMGKPFWSLLLYAIIFSFFASVLSSAVMIVGVIVIGICTALGFLAGDAGGAIGSATGMVITALLTLAAYAVAGVFFLYAPVTVAVDHEGPFTALGKSFRYASANFKAYFWSLYAYTHLPILFLPFIGWLVLLILGAGRFVAPSLGFELLYFIGTTLGGIIFFAMLSSLQALIYIDARCRIEGYDLINLARQVGLGDEIARALTQTANRPATAAYPNYAAVPTVPASVSAAVPGLTAPQSTGGFPDYSAPPPVEQAAAPMPLPELPAPDYAAPPAGGMSTPRPDEEEDADAR